MLNIYSVTTINQGAKYTTDAVAKYFYTDDYQCLSASENAQITNALKIITWENAVKPQVIGNVVIVASQLPQ